MQPGEITSLLTEILTVAKSTLQFCFISAGTATLTYIKTKNSSFGAKNH